MLHVVLHWERTLLISRIHGVLYDKCWNCIQFCRDGCLALLSIVVVYISLVVHVFSSFRSLLVVSCARCVTATFIIIYLMVYTSLSWSVLNETTKKKNFVHILWIFALIILWCYFVHANKISWCVKEPVSMLFFFSHHRFSISTTQLTSLQFNTYIFQSSHFFYKFVFLITHHWQDSIQCERIYADKIIVYKYICTKR